ncbi:MAG: DUF4286 family protein [Chitinophagaceae bacterium]
MKVDPAVAADWRVWMLREHIPMLMDTGCFTDAKMFRLLEQDDSDGPTFCAQYYCASRADYDRYINDFASAMRAETMKLWADKIVAFRSIMQLQ